MVIKQAEEVEETDLEQLTASVTEAEDGTQIIHLSAEEVSASPAASTPSRAKQKQYAQRYRREWERLEFCRGWLRVSGRWDGLQVAPWLRAGHRPGAWRGARELYHITV